MAKSSTSSCSALYSQNSKTCARLEFWQFILNVAILFRVSGSCSVFSGLNWALTRSLTRSLSTPSFSWRLRRNALLNRDLNSPIVPAQTILPLIMIWITSQILWASCMEWELIRMEDSFWRQLLSRISWRFCRETGSMPLEGSSNSS